MWWILWVWGHTQIHHAHESILIRVLIKYCHWILMAPQLSVPKIQHPVIPVWALKSEEKKKNHKITCILSTYRQGLNLTYMSVHVLWVSLVQCVTWDLSLTWYWTGKHLPLSSWDCEQNLIFHDCQTEGPSAPCYMATSVSCSEHGGVSLPTGSECICWGSLMARVWSPEPMVEGKSQLPKAILCLLHAYA